MAAGNRAVAGESGWWLRAVVLGMIVGVLGLLCVRALYGVDLTDESFYAALAYRFARGDRPMLDEYVAVQGTGALLSPLVRGFVAARGTDGLIAFLRATYLLTVIGAMGLVWRMMRSHTSPPIALLMALMVALFQPFLIPALSYNSLGGLAFAVGCVAGFAARRRQHDARLCVLAGIAHAVCVVAYPTLAAGVLTFVVLAGAGLDARRRRVAAIAYVGGAAVVVVSVLLVLRPALDEFPKVLAYSAAMGLQGDGWNATRLRLSTIREAHDLRYVMSATAWLYGLVGLLVARRDKLSMWIAAGWMIAGALLVPRYQSHTGSLELMSWLGLGTVVVGLASCTGTVRSVLARTVLLPALIGGLATAWSSSNGYIAGAVGLLPAVVFLPYVLSRMGRTDGDGQDSGAAEAIAPVVASMVASMIVAAALMLPLMRDAGIYRDAPRSRMDCVVAEGPFRGLRTSCARAKDTRKLATDLAGTSGSSLAVIGGPPGAYLLAERRIASNATWLTPTALEKDAYQQLFLDYVTARGNAPDVVLWSDAASEWTAIYAWLQEHYVGAVTRDGYALMKLKPR